MIFIKKKWNFFLPCILTNFVFELWLPTVYQKSLERVPLFEPPRNPQNTAMETTSLIHTQSRNRLNLQQLHPDIDMKRNRLVFVFFPETEKQARKSLSFAFLI